MRTLHGPDLLANFVTRLLSTLADKFDRYRIWSPRMVVLALIVAASFGSGRNRLAWQPLLMRLHREYGDDLKWEGVPDPSGLYRAMQKGGDKGDTPPCLKNKVVCPLYFPRLVRCQIPAWPGGMRMERGRRT